MTSSSWREGRPASSRAEQRDCIIRITTVQNAGAVLPLIYPRRCFLTRAKAVL